MWGGGIDTSTLLPGCVEGIGATSTMGMYLASLELSVAHCIYYRGRVGLESCFDVMDASKES